MRTVEKSKRLTRLGGEESFKHNLAIQLLWKWLNEAEIAGRSISPFAWRSPNWGVHIELPFFETSDPNYFEHSFGLIDDINEIAPRNEYKSIDELFRPSANLGRLLFIPDITIFHKGQAAHFVEVVHTNPVSIDKLHKIADWWKYKQGGWLNIWEVEAEWVLRQTKEPSEVQATLIFEL